MKAGFLVVSAGVLVAGGAGAQWPAEGTASTGGGLPYHNSVEIGAAGQDLPIDLPNPSRAKRSPESTVSIRQLQHKIPAAARKTYAKGRNAATRGHRQEAVAYFQKAVTLDPEYADAYNDLGAVYLVGGEYEQAAEQFQKVIELIPDHRLALTNLSVVLVRLSRLHEAGEAARRSLKIDPRQSRLHLILAASLIGEAEGGEEALVHLKYAASEIPKAHLMAAELLAKAARPAEAAQQLEEYLRAAVPQDGDRSKAEEMLARLRRKADD